MAQAVVLDAAAAVLRPRMRGWLHAAAVPVTLVAGLVLVLATPAGTPRVGTGVFALSALVLFGVSALLHRGGWSPRVERLLTRADHASIFLLIAGTYTPCAVLLLDGVDRTLLLAIAWGGALLGIAFRMLWPTAPRWVCTPVYLALGWAAVPFAPQLARHADLAVLVLIALGGLVYTLGAIVYGLRRPDPFPQWFGFHEVFHACTVVAFAAHFAGITLAASALR